jgi:hypothetical protein
MTRAGEDGKERDGVGRLLKWVGAASAVLGLVFALVRATEMVTDRMERGRRLRELQALAQRQLEAGDHRAAWASAQAASSVEPRRGELRRLQEDVAMAWIRSASIRVATGDDGPSLGVRTFAELVDPLVATLDQGALAATGQRQADLLAHRGWAEYLRGRDDVGRRPDPTPFYRSALAADPRNPYAHGLWGLGIALSRRAPREAREHFAQAVAGGRERAFVRQLQLVGLLVDVTPEGDVELLRAVDAIRREGGTVGPGPRRQLHGRYWFRMPDSTRRPVLLTALPADSHLATYRWLFAEDLRDSTREASYTVHLAQLQEHAGDTAGAVALMRRLRATRDDLRPGERELLDAAIARAARD